ncbi:DEAD/DEAH box helicase [Streptomyces tsukubensis]|nr:DEAD/DEAH box helicase [Streptomyces tsukubensis]
MPPKPDDDALAERTRAERVEAGIEAYDPDDVPPATDVRSRGKVTESEQYRGMKAEMDRQVRAGELAADQLWARKERAPYPPTRYEV